MSSKRRPPLPFVIALLAATPLSLLVGVVPLAAQVGGASGSPLPGLSRSEKARFQAGRAEFVKLQTVAGGLGPVFNEHSCAACHADPVTGGGSDVLATRIGAGMDPLIDLGGPTIQTKGIGPFGGVVFSGEVVPPQAPIVAHRRTVPLFGLGLVDAVPDSTFLALAAMEASRTPGTAGRPNVVTSLRTGQKVVGRFGWKAQSGSVYDFAVGAYKDELGVTTAGFTVLGAKGPSAATVYPYFRDDDGRHVSEENAPQGNEALLQFDPVPGPDERDDTDLLRIADFVEMLAPPPSHPLKARGRVGQKVFAAIGCADCHQPTLMTGPHPIRALSHKQFHPYSDFLLHDMGALGDGIDAASARGTEMRTSPLWGLSSQPSFLHDGRAATVDEAILQHDGQARPAAIRYRALPPTSRAALLEFLGSL